MHSAAGLHPDALEELTAVPRLPSWIRGLLLMEGKERDGKEDEGTRREGRKEVKM